MGENSKIAWTDHTFNPWIGCTKVSAACDNCYAEDERCTKALGVRWGHGQPRHRTAASTWSNPIKWDRKAAAEDIRYRVFCASLADVFDTEVDPQWREDLFTLIDLTPNLDWLLLTKRPKVAAEYFNGEPTPPNVWVGTTVETKKMMAARLPHLMAINAPVRFLSVEPQLERIPLRGPPGVDWVIVGAESGPSRRPFDLDWARLLRDQCQIAGIPFFLKQTPANTRKGVIETPELDGRRWVEFPVSAGMQ